MCTRVPSVEDDGGASVCGCVLAWMCVLCVCAWLAMKKEK